MRFAYVAIGVCALGVAFWVVVGVVALFRWARRRRWSKQLRARLRNPERLRATGAVRRA
jgi:ABC-type transporter Mla subunit MlaD